MSGYDICIHRVARLWGLSKHEHMIIPGMQHSIPRSVPAGTNEVEDLEFESVNNNKTKINNFWKGENCYKKC